MKIAHVTAGAPPGPLPLAEFRRWHEADQIRMYSEAMRQLCEFIDALEERAELAADGATVH